MSKRVYLLGVAIALVAAAFVTTDAVVGPRAGPTEANAKRVKPGMTLREVEAILGGRGRQVLAVYAGGAYAMYEWSGSGGIVRVCLCGPMSDEEPHTVENVWFERTAGPSLIERLRTFLGL
jgi:hypothetical protein